MRLADADRERLAEMLARHMAAGRLSVEELDRRLTRLFAAESREEAGSLVADLPPLPRSRPRPGRGRGHGEVREPQPEWVATSERFRDPSSHRIMRVWVDPASGDRHYVPDEGD